jgi:hypothetical protein
MNVQQPGVQERERDLVTRCVGDAYEVLDLIPGVNPNGPILVWLAENFKQIRKAHSDG